jgi:hypothetical protein
LIVLVCAIITALIIYAVVQFRQYLNLSANIVLITVLGIAGICVLCFIIWFISFMFSKISDFTTQISINKLEVKKHKEEIKQKYPNTKQEERVQQSYYKTDALPPKPVKETAKTQDNRQSSNQVQQKKGIEPVYYADIVEYLEQGSILHGIRKDDTISTGEWNDNKTTLILGTGSSGKTNTMVVKAVNAIMSNSLIIVCDPHAMKERSLTRRLYPFKDFLYPGTIFAVEHSDIYNNIKILTNELNNRLHKKGPFPKIVIFIDEWNRLMRDEKLAKYLSNLVEVLGQEATGFNIYAVIACQQITGNVILRKSVSSYIIHRVDQTEAKLIVPPNFAKYAPQLPTGISIVKDADGYIELLQQVIVTKVDILEIIKLKSKQIIYLKDQIIQSMQVQIKQDNSKLVRKIEPTNTAYTNLKTETTEQRKQRKTTDLRPIHERPTVKLNQTNINYKSYKQLNQPTSIVSSNATWNEPLTQHRNIPPHIRHTQQTNNITWNNEPTEIEIIQSEITQEEFPINETKSTPKTYNIGLPNEIIQTAIEMAKAGFSRRKIREATKLEGTKYKILKELLDSEGL